MVAKLINNRHYSEKIRGISILVAASARTTRLWLKKVHFGYNVQTS